MKKVVVVCLVLLFAQQALALNSVKGRMVLSKEGTITFEGDINRDDLEVELLLNDYRMTPIKESQHVYMEFEGAELTKEGDDWIFQLYLGEWFDEYDLIIEFPEGVRFKETSSNIAYEKFDSSLHFKDELVENPQIDVIYTIEEEPVLEKEESTSFTIYLIPIILLGLVAMMLLRLRKEDTLNEEILKTLNEKEASIIQLLFENGGKLTQTRLRQKTGLPKSTLSNILRDLETRELIKRYEHGSTFDIELEKRVIS